VTALVLLDDAAARSFEPFALTRPVCELRAGALLIRERWEIALGERAAGFVGAAHLDDFEEGAAAGAIVQGELAAGTIVANARALPRLEAIADPGVERWLVEGRLAALRLPRAVPVQRLRAPGAELEALAASGGRAVDVPGRWLDAPWDLVRHLSEMLNEDIPRLGAALAARDPVPSTVLPGHPVFVEDGATVEPHTLLDASQGPILVRRGAHVHAFTRLVGPCLIGPDSSVMGDRIASVSVGEVCRVHGEVSMTIFLGHANKAHSGFIGHSVLGRWVNLGASTVNSNLKNTYGSVMMWTPQGARDSSMQFLGALFGDHAKTGIGTRLTTGSVIGAGANVVYDGVAPKTIAPFAWGPGAQVYDLERFLHVAERAMARRNVTLGERGRRQLAAAHARRWRA
jgi:UDP-N-acetylglucosamine diphosphorylase / glucose-1-phosphate thymidylyltransferase / UDP-N-acetylgalactosamine diphosphorylase / glucosamine-1-phosphate N-acetyltransferase / galactosamine-1-phosphate N-acetyltransferase